MLEWIDHLTAQRIQLHLQTSLRFPGDKLDRALLIRADLLLVGLLVLVQEVCELFVVSELCFLHWDNQLDVPLEVLEVIHENSLLFYELGDFGVVLLDLGLGDVDVGDLDVILIPL